VPSTSYLWSHFPRWYRGSAIGWYSLFFATSYAAAPLIAAFLIFGYSLNLPAALAVVMSAAAILLAVHLRLGAGHEDFWRALKEAIRDDGIVVKEVRDMMHLSAKEIALLFNMFVFGFWWVTFQLGAPLLFFIGEGSLWEAAIFMAAFSLPFAAMDMCYGRLCNITKNRMRFLYLGMSISAALLVAFYFADNFLLLLLIGVAMVVSTDAAWVANEVHLGSHLPKGKKGEYTGVFLLGKELGYSFAPVFYGLFAVAGLKVPFLALGALMLIGWLFFSITHRFGRA
jgi:MFS family permease